MKRKAAERDRVLEPAWICLAVIVFGLVIAIRIRLLGIPLERDEGEYAYAGQLMLQAVRARLQHEIAYAAYAHLTVIDAPRLLATDYSWRVFDTSIRQSQLSVILIGSLP